MNEFDLKAADWDKNPMHLERSAAIAGYIKKLIHLDTKMTALEYGAGTGITSFILADSLKEIVMMDNSSGMISILDEKIRSSNFKNLKSLEFDLENDDYADMKFDLIFTQMVLHHVTNYESIIYKFRNLLNPGGYVAIADLCKEDGSFHGDGFTGQRGFDPEELGRILLKYNFTDLKHEKCFTIEKKLSTGDQGKFDVFILTGHLR